MNLADAKLGQRLKVERVLGQGPLKRRIMEMGITKGTDLYIDRVSPLGDPIYIRVRDFSLALRKEDAENILVSAGEGR